MSERLIQGFRRIMATIGRGKVTLVDDSGVVQRLQVDLGPTGPDGSLEVHDNLPFVQLFGFSGAPPAGSDAIVLFIGGDRSRAIGIGANHQASRLRDLSPGDSAVHDVRQAYLKFVNGGPVLDAAGGDITIQNYGTMTIQGGVIIADGADVRLGGSASGMPAVARVGDAVDLAAGTISAGSGKVTAAD